MVSFGATFSVGLFAEDVTGSAYSDGNAEEESRCSVPRAGDNWSFKAPDHENAINRMFSNCVERGCFPSDIRHRSVLLQVHNE